jgi:hypothetical protein
MVMVAVLVLRRKRVGLCLAMLLALLALQHIGCTTDAPTDRRGHAHRVDGKGGNTGSDGEPQARETGDSEAPDAGAETDDMPGCPDPRTCGDPYSNVDAGTN